MPTPTDFNRIAPAEQPDDMDDMNDMPTPAPGFKSSRPQMQGEAPAIIKPGAGTTTAPTISPQQVDVASRYVAAIFAGRASSEVADNDRILRSIVRVAHKLAAMTLYPALAEPTAEDLSQERADRLAQLREHRKQVMVTIENLAADAPADYVDQLHDLATELRQQISRLEGDA